MKTLSDVKATAMEELCYWFKTEDGWNKAEEDVNYAIFEIVDGCIPVSNRVLLEVAMSNMRLACSLPESPFEHGENNACRLIALNLFEYLYEELQERYAENRP